MDLKELRRQMPELAGLSDEESVDVLQQAYYPDLPRDKVAAGLGVKLAPPPAPPAPERTALGTLADTALSTVKGAVQLPEAAVGAADLVSGGRAGKALADGVAIPGTDASLRFDPKAARQVLDSGMSDAQQYANEQVQKAEGFWNTVKAAVSNPSTIFQSAVESVPGSVAGGMIGKGIMGLRIAGLGGEMAGALGEGAIGAAQSAEQYRQETPDGLLTGQQAGLAVASGAGDTLFAAIGNKVASALGFHTIDNIITGAATNPKAAKGVAKQVLLGFVSEGALEELPQSIHEQVMQNLALGKPIDDGVSNAAVMGFFTGGLMGAGTNAMAGLRDMRRPSKIDAEVQEAANTPRPTPAPGMPPAAPSPEGVPPGDVPPSATAGSPSIMGAPTVDAAIAAADAALGVSITGTSPASLLGSTAGGGMLGGADPSAALLASGRQAFEDKQQDALGDQQVADMRTQAQIEAQMQRQHDPLELPRRALKLPALDEVIQPGDIIAAKTGAPLTPAAARLRQRHLQQQGQDAQLIEVAEGGYIVRPITKGAVNAQGQADSAGGAGGNTAAPGTGVSVPTTAAAGAKPDTGTGAGAVAAPAPAVVPDAAGAGSAADAASAPAAGGEVRGPGSAGERSAGGLGTDAAADGLAESSKERWLRALASQNRFAKDTDAKITGIENGRINFSGDPQATKAGRGLFATYNEAVKAGATPDEILAAINAPAPTAPAAPVPAVGQAQRQDAAGDSAAGQAGAAAAGNATGALTEPKLDIHGREVGDAVEKLELPHARKGWQGVLPASIAVHRMADGSYGAARGYNAGTQGYGSPVGGHATFATRDEAVADAANDLRRHVASQQATAEGKEKLELARISAWLNKISPANDVSHGTDIAGADEKSAPTAAQGEQPRDEATGQYVEAAAATQAPAEAPAAPEATTAPAPSPAEAKKQAAVERAATREKERDLYRTMAADDSLDGKGVPEIAAAIRARLDGVAVSDEQIDKLAKAVHRQLAKTSAERAKAKNRDPAVLAAAIRNSLPPEGMRSEVVDSPEKLAAHALGFQHALADKTKSTLSGDHLPAMLAGYESGMQWRDTEEGSAFFEGRAVNKLKNTGVDLRRYWDELAAQMKGNESDVQKAWKQIERATARADLFAPLIPEGASPAFTMYGQALRDATLTFKQWLDEHYADWYGSSHYRSRYSESKSNTEYILTGERYPRGPDKEKFQDDEAFRADWLREAANTYIAQVRAATEWLQGRSSVREAADAFTEKFIDPAAEESRYNPASVLRQQYRKLVAPRSEKEAVFNDTHGFMKLRAGTSYTDDLAAREANNTVVLPSKNQPLTPPKLDRVTRSGLPDHRGGKDVTPAQFKEKFGFADVGFGTWVGAKQDQDHLNYSYDALMDMAQLTGVDPKYIGFGKNLHFTIGALGRGGKAAAHFHASQPAPFGGVVSVINVTNTKGDGTVHHEWTHALDHFLGGEWKATVRPMLQRLINNRIATPESVEAEALKFLLGRWYYKGDGGAKKRDDSVKVDNAIKGLRYDRNNPGQNAYKTNADKLGKDYWGNEHEMLARASEAWAVDMLGDKRDTYLVNPEWAGDGAVTGAKNYRGTPYPTGEERKQISMVIGALFKAVKWDGEGQPTITKADFQAALPEAITAGEKRRAELMDEDAMYAFYEKAQQAAIARTMEQQADQQAKEQAERAESDRLAAEKLAELEESTVDQPQPDETPGPLDEGDLEALFDQAAAELREQGSNEPESAPPPVPGEEPEPTAAAVPAGGKPQPGEAGYTLAVAEADLEAMRTNTGERGAMDDRLTDRIKRQEKLIAEMKADAAPQSKSASALLAEAAKLGVKGADEALSGLAKLFGSGPGKLNSFPGGFDEDTYLKAKPHFQAALEAFQAAGRTLKDLFKLLIQQFGDGVKPYAVRFAKDMELTASLGQAPAAGKAASPGARVAKEVVHALTVGGKIQWQALFSLADAEFGGTQAEGKYSPKDAYDALEAGINLYIMENATAFDPRAGREQAIGALGALERLLALVPTQTKRTAEQDSMQQFSTVPTLAYVANWVANVSSADTMLEPSAGIGGLAVFAKNAGAKVVLNELSSRRAALLQEVFPGSKVMTENAEQLHNILPESVQPTVVVMNPPFSNSAGGVRGDTMIGAKHVEQALLTLAPGGRLVAIVGEGMARSKPAFRDWWKKIDGKYDVRAAVVLDGSGYAKYGTTFDNVLVVIDKAAPASREPIATKLEKYEDLIPLLQEIRNERPATTVPADDGASLEQDAAESALADAVPAGQGDTGAGPAGDGAHLLGEGQPGGREPGMVAGGGGSGSGGRGGKRAGNVSQSGSSRTAAGDNAAPGGANAGAQASGSATGVTVSAEDEQIHKGEITDSVFEGYTPQRLKVEGAKPHPGALVQSAAMATVLPPVPTYTPNLPAKTITEGKLSIAQIEAVVYAGQAHSETLPTAGASDKPQRRGFFIGDGTGVGKGREIGGIILDNLRQGRKRHVWVSEKQGLMKDAKRDFKGVGGNEDLIFNQNKTGSEDAIEDKDGILFTTYSTLRSGALSQAAGTDLKPMQLLRAFPKQSLVKAKDGGAYHGRQYFVASFKDVDKGFVRVSNGYREFLMPVGEIGSIDGVDDWRKGRPQEPAAKDKKAGQARIDQLAKWLGEDFDGVLVFDEAHNAGNAVPMKGERGMSDPSAQALAVVELQKKLPNARVVYVSATGATQVSNLSYATRLGLWGPGTPFPAVSNFIAEMTSGGLATMELVARDMKQMGAYLARSLSFDGVTYSRVEHELTPIQHDIYNRLAEGWQVTLQNFNAALEATGGDKSGKAKMAAKSAYWGAQQRFFNQVITSMQMPSVLEQIDADLKNGNAVILQLVNTNEAQQNRAIAKRRADDEEGYDLEDLDLTPRDQLMQMIEKSFPVQQYEEYVDEDGKRQSRPVMDAGGNPVQNKEAVAMRDKLLEDLKDIKVPDGPLELILNQFGPEITAEVTGRTQRVVNKVDAEGVTAKVLETRGSSAAQADADAFMADKKRILVFSDAGGTGFSFHADMTKANQRKRSHYLIQPGWRADKAVQGLGRSHRTNQSSEPHYKLASTDIPAHKRFLSAIARRLDMLGALTKGQRDTANQGLFSEKDNLESKYATQAVRQFFEDGARGMLGATGIDFKGELLKQMGLEDIIDQRNGTLVEDKIPSTRLFLNRMLSLTIPMQHKVFGAFISMMEEKVDVAIQRNELDTGLQTIKALSATVKTDDVVYTDPRTGAETRMISLDLKQPTRIFSFPTTDTEKRPVEYYANVASGRIWARVPSGQQTLKNGSVVNRYAMRGTGSTQFKNATDFIGPKQQDWTKLNEEQARELWEKENAAKPATYSTEAHMIVGAMLPIWDRLKTDGQLRVARTQTTDGRRLLGRMIDAKDVADVRKRLNVANPASKLSPTEVMAAILKGKTGELANGWRLERVRVSNDLRIEIRGTSMNGATVRELTAMGVMQERISWQDRYFVPTGAAGVPVLEKLFATKPLVDLIDPLATKAADGDQPEMLQDGNQRAPATPQRVGELQAFVDRIAAGWDKKMPVTVVSNVNSQAVPAAIREENARRVEAGKGAGVAVIYRGEVWIFANAVESDKQLMVALAHEVLGHYGLRGHFGAQMEQVRRQVVALRHKDVLAMMERTGITGERAEERAAEEVLAYLAQTQPELGIVQRAIAAVRTWLREHVPGFEKMAFSDDELIRNFILPARQYVEGDGPRGGGKQSEQDEAASSTASTNPLDKQELREKIRARAREMFVDEPGLLRMANWVVNSRGLTVNGVHDTKGVINISLDGPNPVATFNHEAFHHAMRYNFTLHEQGVLKARFRRGSEMAKRVEQAMIADGREDLVKYRQSYLYEKDDIGNEEIVAFAFQHWVDNKLTFDTPTTSAFQSIYDFMDRIAHWLAEVLSLSGVRFPASTSAEKLFVRLDSGEFRTSPNGRGPGARVSEQPSERGDKVVPLNPRDATQKLAAMGYSVQQNYQDEPGWIEHKDGTVYEWDDAARRFEDDKGNALPQEAADVAQYLGNVHDGIEDPEAVSGAANDRNADPFSPAFAQGERTVQVDGVRRPVERADGSLIVGSHNVAQLRAFWRAFAGETDEQGRPKVTDQEVQKLIGDEPAFQQNVEDAPNDPRSYKDMVREALDELNNTPGKLHWWHKSLGTQYNLARKSPAFKSVFDKVQDFLSDVSVYATEAADAAPALLPKLESIRDITKAALSAKDTKAIAAPIFEGTLLWGRGSDGQVAKIADLEREANTTSAADKAQDMLRRGLLTPQVLSMWQGLPHAQYEKNVESRWATVAMRPGVVFTPAELKKHFGLNDEQVGYYKQFRKAVDTSITNLATSELVRAGGATLEPIRTMMLDTGDVGAARALAVQHIDQLIEEATSQAERDELNALAKRLQDKADRAMQLMAEGYAPLSRFGHYTVDVVGKDGQRLFFSMYESRFDAMRAAKQFEQLAATDGEYTGATINRGTISQEEYKLFAGVSPETVELFGEMLGLDSTGDSAADKAFQAYLQLAKNNRSAMKRLIHRKGIAGFSQDTGRVLAGFVYSNARMTARNIHAGDVERAINEIPKGQGELKDAAIKLRDYVHNPVEEAQALRGMLFAQYLGGSIAAALVNMTQPFTMTLPYLSQFGGIRAASGFMGDALKVAWAKTTGDDKLDAALRRATEDGIVAPQEVHQLIAQAQGRGALRSGDGTAMGDAAAAANNALARLTLAWGKPFSTAELFNRRVTFVAAWKAAKAQGKDDAAAFEFAEQAVTETQGLYNKGNRPRWARGIVGATAMTFRQFSIAYLEMIERMWNAGAPGSEERAAGRRAVFFAAGIMLLAGGAGGLPFAEDVSDLVDGLMQRLGYNWSTKQKRQELLEHAFGRGLGHFLEKGVSGLPGVPIDVAGRLGLGNLIPATGALQVKTDRSKDMLELLGPTGDMAQRAIQAGDLAAGGHVIDAGLQVSPLAARNIAKGVDMLTSGQYSDQRGYKVMDTTPADAAVKVIGFQPSQVARVQEADRAAQSMVALAKLRESEIAGDWAKAIAQGDPGAGREAAQAAIDSWNEKNPDTPIKVKAGDVMRRAKNMQMDRATRIEKSAPKEIRSTVRDMLREE